MQEEARRLQKDKDPRQKSREQRSRLGSVRGDLIGVDGPEKEKVKGSEDDFKEDAVSKLIQSGQAKVAPEYRDALADYYKAVAE